MAQAEQIILLTRYPEPGRTKTRLIPRLGPQGAADLQRHMTERILAVARRVAADRRADLVIHLAGGDSAAARRWLGTDLMIRPQAGGDLGRRMEQAFHEAFDEGARRAVLVGTDCPELDAGILAAAFTSLTSREPVLGPAHDGGYYLIGLTRLHRELFTGPYWGGSEVLQTTLEIASGLGLSPHLLRPLHDVDRPGDLVIWERLPPLANG